MNHFGGKVSEVLNRAPEMCEVVSKRYLVMTELSATCRQKPSFVYQRKYNYRWVK